MGGEKKITNGRLRIDGEWLKKGAEWEKVEKERMRVAAGVGKVEKGVNESKIRLWQRRWMRKGRKFKAGLLKKG